MIRDCLLVRDKESRNLWVSEVTRVTVTRAHAGESSGRVARSYDRGKTLLKWK